MDFMDQEQKQKHQQAFEQREQQARLQLEQEQEAYRLNGQEEGWMHYYQEGMSFYQRNLYRTMAEEETVQITGTADTEGPVPARKEGAKESYKERRKRKKRCESARKQGIVPLAGEMEDSAVRVQEQLQQNGSKEVYNELRRQGISRKDTLSSICAFMPEALWEADEKRAKAYVNQYMEEVRQKKEGPVHEGIQKEIQSFYDHFAIPRRMTEPSYFVEHFRQFQIMAERAQSLVNMNSINLTVYYIRTDEKEVARKKEAMEQFYAVYEAMVHSLGISEKGEPNGESLERRERIREVARQRMRIAKGAEGAQGREVHQRMRELMRQKAPGMIENQTDQGHMERHKVSGMKLDFLKKDEITEFAALRDWVRNGAGTEAEAAEYLQRLYYCSMKLSDLRMEACLLEEERQIAAGQESLTGISRFMAEAGGGVLAQRQQETERIRKVYEDECSVLKDILGRMREKIPIPVHMEENMSEQDVKVYQYTSGFMLRQ